MEPTVDLKELLFRIRAEPERARRDADCDASRYRDADLSVIAPQFAGNLGTALEANRQRYAQELANKKVELELLRATVSKVVM